jgi:hypothetical protein
MDYTLLYEKLQNAKIQNAKFGPLVIWPFGILTICHSVATIYVYAAYTP